MKRLSVVFVFCMIMSTPILTSSCGDMESPIGSLLMLGATAWWAYQEYGGDVTQVELTVVNNTTKTMKIWIDFDEQGSIIPGGSAKYDMKIGAHTLQAGETIPEYSATHTFVVGQPYSWTLD
jgi:hypothetical protein